MVPVPSSDSCMVVWVWCLVPSKRASDRAECLFVVIGACIRGARSTALLFKWRYAVAKSARGCGVKLWFGPRKCTPELPGVSMQLVTQAFSLHSQTTEVGSMEADSGCKLAERSNAGLIVVMMAFLKALPSVLCDNSNF